MMKKLSYFCFLCLLLSIETLNALQPSSFQQQQKQQKQQPKTTTTTTTTTTTINNRRNFLSNAAGGATAAIVLPPFSFSSSSILFPTNNNVANAAPMEPLPLPPPEAIPRLPKKGNPVIEALPTYSMTNNNNNKLVTKLGKSRIGATELSPLQSSLSPFASQELYYPSWLFGSWNVTTTLQQKYYPYGTEFVPSKTLIEGSPRNRYEKIGDSTTYEAHYFSTLADTMANQATVNLGLGVPQSKIIADRAYNAISVSKAYEQLLPIEQVEWDYRNDPTRMTIRFQSLSADMRPLGQRRGEVYYTARQFEDYNDNNDSSSSLETLHYATAERSRLLTVGEGNVIVSDLETISEFTKQNINDSNNTVSAIVRTAVYLSPNPNSKEGLLWQQVNGKAVAFFDYLVEMKRNVQEFTTTTFNNNNSNNNDDSKEKVSSITMFRACVETPKNVIQCE